MGRSALASQVARVECGVGGQVELLGAVFEAERNPQAILGRWQRQAVFPQVARQVDALDALRRAAALEARRLQVGQCARTGVTAAQYGKIEDNPAGQYNAIFGGAADLKPEKSDSYTLGLVLTPVRDLSVTIDAFDMKVKGVIGALPPDTTLANCLETGNPAACALITRDREGTLWLLNAGHIVAFNQNLAMRKTKGVDLGANYRYRWADLGAFDFAFTGTYLKEFIREDSPGTGEFDCAGLHGTVCGIPLPKWRHKARVSWASPWSVDLALTWRHINAVDVENKEEAEPADRRLGARDYLDLSGAFRINKFFTFRAGVNNLFDRDPPVSGIVAATLGNGNTYPQVYDALGRKVFMNLTAKF